MNREILFRGQRVSDSKWVTGYYLFNPTLDEHKIHYWNNCMPIERMTTAIVDPQTVGQYTGLKDKDGVKIWEGDIIDIACLGKYFAKIVYNEEFGAFQCDNGKFHGDRSDHMYGSDSSIVIGNITDNPELLEASK